MFEFQIVVPQSKKIIATKIYENLKEATIQLKSIITTYSENNKEYIVVACENIEKPRIVFIITDVISEIINGFYKLEFIEKNLMLPIKDNINLCAFKKALVAFDKETDKYIIGRELKINKNLFLDEFFNFRLKQLKRKWMEIIKMANDNAGYLLCNDTFIDLLKFLIENIEISRDTVNVLKKGDEFIICDEQFNEIEVDRCTSINENDVVKDQNISLITNLISLSPKKIILHCNICENSPVLSLISQIFDKRICVFPVENM